MRGQELGGVSARFVTSEVLEQAGTGFLGWSVYQQAGPYAC